MNTAGTPCKRKETEAYNQPKPVRQVFVLDPDHHKKKKFKL